MCCGVYRVSRAGRAYRDVRIDVEVYRVWNSRAFHGGIGVWIHLLSRRLNPKSQTLKP